MELRAYAAILWRYLWLLIALPALVGLLSLLTYTEPPPNFAYTVKFSVSFLPVVADTLEQDPRLGAVQASEYVADDLTEIFRGSQFAAMVRERLPEDYDLSMAAIAGATRAEKLHRILTVVVTAPTAEQAEVLGEAVAQAAQEDIAAMLVDLWGSDVRLTAIDISGPYQIPGGLRSRLDIPLRMALALVAAVVIAFVLEYVDDSVRTRQEAERVVGPVLAEIPRQ